MKVRKLKNRKNKMTYTDLPSQLENLKAAWLDFG